MNKEIVTQVTEIVKSMNIAFDGNLNSETATQIVDKLVPWLIFVQVKGLVLNIIWATALIISFTLISRAIIKAAK